MPVAVLNNRTFNAPSSPWPDATNTGYRNAPGYPGALTPYPGSTVSSNTTYSFYWFDSATTFGSIGANGSPVSNVTFIGCRFTTVGLSASCAIVFGLNGIVFSYCSFEPEPGFSPYQPPVSFANGYDLGVCADGSFNSACGGMLVEYCDLWGFAGAIDSAGSSQAFPQVFQHNWIHDARADGGVDHTDGLGAESGTATSTYVVVDHNTINSPGNTNALAFQRNGTYSNMTITGNLFGGFGYTVAVDQSPGVAQNVTFTDNTFTTQSAARLRPVVPVDQRRVVDQQHRRPVAPQQVAGAGRRGVGKPCAQRPVLAAGEQHHLRD